MARWHLHVVLAKKFEHSIGLFRLSFSMIAKCTDKSFRLFNAMRWKLRAIIFQQQLGLDEKANPAERAAAKLVEMRHSVICVIAAFLQIARTVFINAVEQRRANDLSIQFQTHLEKTRVDDLVFDIGLQAPEGRTDFAGASHIATPREHREAFNQIHARVHEFVRDINVLPLLPQLQPRLITRRIENEPRNNLIVVRQSHEDYFDANVTFGGDQQIADRWSGNLKKILSQFRRHMRRTDQLILGMRD